MNDPRSARDVPFPPWRTDMPTCPACGRASNHGYFQDCPAGITAKPSPREALLSIVARLREEAAKANQSFERLGDPGRGDVFLGKDVAYRHAITLIRSMAGHLMEE